MNNVRRLALIPAAALLLAACSSGAGSPSSPPSTLPAASASAATLIEVSLTDTLEITMSAMAVPVGVPVTFRVTNMGKIDHEFFLGDEDAQAGHEQEMMAMGGMGHDEADGIGVKPGETKELMYTFSKPGGTFVGCHVGGHYAGGMKAALMVIG